MVACTDPKYMMKYIFIAINYFEKYFKQFCSLLKEMDTYETEFINAKINEIRILYIFILFFLSRNA